MLLPLNDVELFFKLHRELMFFVNQRLGVIPNIESSQDFASLPPEERLAVRKAFLEHADLLQQFVDENPARLPKDELAIVSSWREFVRGKFCLLRQMTQYMIFLTVDDPPIAYGVRALSQPFDQVAGPHLPTLVETMLLPFKDLIVYDGLMTTYRISFGPGARRSMNESYKEAKARHGIVQSLPMSSVPLPPKPVQARKAPKPPSKEQKEEVVETVIGLIDNFCKKHLNSEYAVLCRKLAEKLGRKRPSPFLRGDLNSWASGVVRVIGGVNFLHDSSQSPYMRATEIDSRLGANPANGAAKAAAIRKMLRIHQFDHHWTLPSRMEDSPMIWMVEVNGFPIDIRRLPREAQELAFKKDMIPYIPADRQGGK